MEIPKSLARQSLKANLILPSLLQIKEKPPQQAKQKTLPPITETAPAKTSFSLI
jgi:hypothetical protein